MTHFVQSAGSATPPPAEFEQRLKIAGAKSGDVQVTLIWFNRNDLDLHCIEPNGNEIFWNRRRSNSGGELDVDMNVTPTTDRPVENVYWPKGRAPLGRYRVFVNYYANHGGRDPSEYKVSVLANGERHEFSGNVSAKVRKVLVCEFDVLPPSLKLAVPSEMRIDPKGENTLPLRILREGFTGPVEIRLDGDLSGIRPSESSIPEDRDDFEIVLVATDAAVGSRDIRVKASGRNAGGGAVDAEGALTLIVARPAPKSTWSWTLALVIGLWTALLAVGLSLALVIGQNRYLGRPFLSTREGAMLTLGSLVAGAVAGGGGQVVYGMLSHLRLFAEIGFVAGWLLLGALLGRGVVFFIPNLDSWRATLAGACGGLIGAVAFIAVSFIGDIAGRLVGAGILGFAIGLMVALMEAAGRRYWLEVTFGQRAANVVNLGVTPVFVGGNPDKCTIAIPGAPERALKFWEGDGQVFCLDVLAEKTFPVTAGYRHRLRDAAIAVCSSDKTGEEHRSPRPVSPSPVIPTARLVVPSKPKAAKPPKAPADRSKTPAPVKSLRAAPAPAPAIKPVPCPECGCLIKGLGGRRVCPNCATAF